MKACVSEQSTCHRGCNRICGDVLEERESGNQVQVMCDRCYRIVVVPEKRLEDFNPNNWKTGD